MTNTEKSQSPARVTAATIDAWLAANRIGLEIAFKWREQLFPKSATQLPPDQLAALLALANGESPAEVAYDHTQFRPSPGAIEADRRARRPKQAEPTDPFTGKPYERRR